MLLLYVMGQVTHEYCGFSINIFLFTGSYSDCKLLENWAIFFERFSGRLLFFKSNIGIHNIGAFNVFFEEMTGFSAHFVGFDWNGSEPYFLYFSIFVEELNELVVFSL